MSPPSTASPSALIARGRAGGGAGDPRALRQPRAAPGLPYVTAAQRRRRPIRRLQGGIAAAFADPALAETRAALALDGCEILPRAAYEVILPWNRRRSPPAIPRLA